MLKFIAILTSCSLALALSVQAREQNDKPDAKKHSQKPKNVQKQPQLKTQNTHVQKVHTDHVNKPVVTNTNTNVTKKKEWTPSNQTNTHTNIQSNTIHKNKEHLESNNQQWQKNKLSQQSITRIQAQHRNFKAIPNTSIASG